jgi:hypothetical protein
MGGSLELPRNPVLETQALNVTAPLPQVNASLVPLPLVVGGKINYVAMTEQRTLHETASTR